MPCRQISGMEEEWRERAWQLFDAAAEMEITQREAFLQRECLNDPELLHEVESLLTHHVPDTGLAADDFLASPLFRPFDLSVADHDPTPYPLPLPSHIGRYRILRLLGSGAVGAVYEAEQDHPRRLVAVKVLRSGFVPDHLKRRLLTEAHILGQLWHKGIAQVYDAGCDAQGQPFFAMELIQGEPLDIYARRRNLSDTARLVLFADICDAVQHAHDRNVIHRDLKPSNILVDSSGQCKILDFGIARSTRNNGPIGTAATETGQLLGTLSYMSPEQISGIPSAVDARSDVYGLGLILFELLSQRQPHDLNELPLPEALRVVREDDPPRLGTIHARFRGDLEIIVRKALEKDKRRRYSSASALATDVRRHLSHLPIYARPPAALYQLDRFCRRNRAVVAIVLTLLLGLIGTGTFAIQAWHGAASARRERAVALLEASIARLSAAQIALTDYDVAVAARHLEAVPPNLRGWEWHHLLSRLDASAERFDFPEKVSAGVPQSHDGLYMATSGNLETCLLDETGAPWATLPYAAAARLVFPVAIRQQSALSAGIVGQELHVIDEAGRIRIQLPIPTDYSGRASAFSSDLRWFANSWVDRGPGVSIYDLHTSQLVSTCHLPSPRIYDVTFSADGNWLGTAGEDGIARLWDVATGQLLREFRGHQANIWSIAFRRDQRRLATASADGKVRQWDPYTGQEIDYPFTGHRGEVMCAEYSPDGNFIASTASDRTIRVWRADGRHELHVFYGHTHRVSELGFSPDGLRLASGGRGSDVRFWNLAPNGATPLVLRAHRKEVNPIAISPDGKWLVSGGWDCELHVWDLQTGEWCARRSCSTPIRCLAFGANPHTIWAGSAQPPYLSGWNFLTDQVLAPTGESSLQAPPDAMTWNHLTDRLATTRQSANIQLWQGSLPQPTQQLGAPVGTEYPTLAFSPSGKWLVTPGPTPNAVTIRDAISYVVKGELIEHTGTVTGVAFDPTDRFLATCSRDQSVRIWELDTGRCTQTLRGHSDEVFAVAYHPTQPRLASAGRDRTIRIWDTTTGKELAGLTGHTGYIWSLQFTADGKTLVSGSGDSTVRLWSVTPVHEYYVARRAAESASSTAERQLHVYRDQYDDAGQLVAAILADSQQTAEQRHAILRAMLRQRSE